VKARLASLVVIGSAVAIACFSERGTTIVNPDADCAVPVTVIDSMHYIVAIRDFSFHPDSLTVPRGATVTWVNCEPAGTEPHTTTSDVAVWSSPDLSPGNRFSHTFPAIPGAFPYHCTPHGFMLGKVIVE
jgi:plastocyanin